MLRCKFQPALAIAGLLQHLRDKKRVRGEIMLDLVRRGAELPVSAAWPAEARPPSATLSDDDSVSHQTTAIEQRSKRIDP